MSSKIDISRIKIRSATQADVPSVTVCICAAFIHYIERIGKQPEPIGYKNFAVWLTDRYAIGKKDGK